MTASRWLSALKKYAIKLVWECSMLKLYLLLLFLFWSALKYIISFGLWSNSTAFPCHVSHFSESRSTGKAKDDWTFPLEMSPAQMFSPHRLPNRSCVFVENNAFLAFLKESSAILILRILSFARNTVLGSKGDRSYQSSNLQYAFHTDFWQISIQC